MALAAPGGGLEVGQRPAGVATGQPDQVVAGVLVELERATQAALVGERLGHHGPDVVVGERLEPEQQAA